MRGTDARGFAWFWGAFSVSTVGDQVTLVAVPLAAYARTHDPLVVGIATSMEALTTVTLGLFAGALADRLPHRRVLVGTDIARTLLLGTLALVVTNHMYPVAALYLVAFGLGTMRQLHDGAAGAALPLIVSPDDLLWANGRLSASESAGNTLGPAIAGVLTSAAGVGAAFIADAASFALSGAGVARVRTLRDRAPDGVPPSAVPRLIGQIGEGLRSVMRDRPLTQATLLAATMNVPAITVEAQFVPYGRHLLHLSALGIGVFYAIGGLSGMAAALAIGRAGAGVQGRAMLAGAAAVSGGLVLAGAAPSRVSAAIAFVGVGAGSMIVITQYAALRQQRFPIGLLGRVTTATRIALRGPLPVVLVLGGVLARAAGLDVLFLVAGLVGGVGVVVVALRGFAAIGVEAADRS